MLLTLSASDITAPSQRSLAPGRYANGSRKWPLYQD